MLKDATVLIAGVDEVGRSSLAGPIVAAAVLFRGRPSELRGIKDSKISRKRGGDERIKRWFKLITQVAASWSVGQVRVHPPDVKKGEDPDKPSIEGCGVHFATLSAMRYAVEQLDPQPAYIFVDGNHLIPGYHDKIQHVRPKLDEANWLVSAASIVARHMRDTLMEDLHSLYPELQPYNFHQNHGERDKEHLAAIRNNGASRYHRRHFADVERENTQFMLQQV